MISPLPHHCLVVGASSERRRSVFSASSERLAPHRPRCFVGARTRRRCFVAAPWKPRRRVVAASWTGRQCLVGFRCLIGASLAYSTNNHFVSEQRPQKGTWSSGRHSAHLPVQCPYAPGNHSDWKYVATLLHFAHDSL